MGVPPGAARLAEAAGERGQLPDILINMARAQRLLGQCNAARDACERVLTLIHGESGYDALRRDVLLLLASLDVALGRWEEALRRCREAMEVDPERDARRRRIVLPYVEALVYSEIGQHRHARHLLQSLESEPALLKLALNSHFRLMVRAASAMSYLRAGDYARAGAVLGEETSMEEGESGRGLNQLLSVKGRLLLMQGRPAEALALLERVIGLWDETGNGTAEVGGLLDHALAAQRAGDLAAARASLSRADKIISAGEVVRYKVYYHRIRFEVTGKIEELQAAREEIQRQAAFFTEDQLRSDFLTRVQLHHEIEERWQAVLTVSHPIGVRLARADAALGKKLADAEYVLVHWTVADGDKDEEILRREGKAALRHQRLRRLLAEAQAQGAARTDDDLARALGVNRRTILRDMAVLRAAGRAPRTRRRH